MVIGSDEVRVGRYVLVDGGCSVGSGLRVGREKGLSLPRKTRACGAFLTQGRGR